MALEDLEKESQATAMKHVINMLQRPGQLEKVEQYKRRVSRKKLSVEAMLKTTMQSQLDGVCVGLGQLQLALQEIKTIKSNVGVVSDYLKEFPDLVKKLQNVRDKHMQYSQYFTARENLKNLFSVPESLEKTNQWINDGKFLYAHHSLNDLETSRDDLLFEVHKLPTQAVADRVLLRASFEGVEAASNLLEKHLRVALSRTLNTVRKEPTVVVTALRIVEKEEKKDAFALQRQKQSGFLPPGRPKRWKNMVMEVLQKSVEQRIEGTQVEDRETNKLWLVVHLELTRQLIMEDLRVVKTLCEPCFPPHYSIVQSYVAMYHNSLSRHLTEIINNGLEGNEYVSVLSWVTKTYAGPDLMQHPDLNVNIQHLDPLLSSQVIKNLQQKYLKNMEDNYVEWMQKTLETEEHDWSTGVRPEDQEGHYHTAAPVIIYQMIDQNLQVTKTISQDLTDKALILSMKQVKQYGLLYREAIITFKIRHFEDRSQVPYFTHYMITIVNNCMLFVELSQQLKQHYWRTDYLNRELTGVFSTLLKTFQDLRNEAANWLLEEAFLDLESHFLDLITIKWLATSIAVDTVCATLEDYFQDYVHLRPSNFEYVITKAINLVAKRYIMAMLENKMILKSPSERKAAGDKIVRETEELRALFGRVAPTLVGASLDAIASLAEILRSEDKEMLALDLTAIVHKSPDIREEHLLKLIALRGDVSRSEARDLIAHIFQAARGSRQNHPGITTTIFSQIPTS